MISEVVEYYADLLSSNGLNILPSYADYFNLNTATTGLNTASVWIGGILAGLTFGKVTDVIGRRPALFWSAIITIIAVILQSAAQNIAMFGDLKMPCCFDYFSDKMSSGC